MFGEVMPALFAEKFPAQATLEKFFPAQCVCGFNICLVIDQLPRSSVPGYTVVGLLGWDDFILTDSKQQFFTIPTVPLEPKHLEPFSFQVDLAAIKPDERFTKKVKWYVKPIIFGGDPSAKENMAWLSFEQHAELVRWWSKLYRDTVAKNQEA